MIAVALISCLDRIYYQLLKNEEDMMGTRINRDPYEMDAFANALDDYVDAVKSSCMKLKSAMDSSATLLGDTKSKEAITRINELLDEILSELPRGTEAAIKIHDSAKPLHGVEDIKFR